MRTIEQIKHDGQCAELQEEISAAIHRIQGPTFGGWRSGPTTNGLSKMIDKARGDLDRLDSLLSELNKLDGKST